MEKLTKQELISLIEDALEIESGSLDENSVSEDIDEWDSLGHLNFLIALDTRCNGKAGEISELATASSLSEILTILETNSLLHK
jgi:hypothetical protein